MFAIVKIGNTQYKVSEKDVILVDKIDGAEGDELTLSDVLLVNDGKSVKVGKPIVKGFTVKAKIVSQEQGEKIHVRRFKSKVRYRRHTGFRAQLTKLEITGVGK